MTARPLGVASVVFETAEHHASLSVETYRLPTKDWILARPLRLTDIVIVRRSSLPLGMGVANARLEETEAEGLVCVISVVNILGSNQKGARHVIAFDLFEPVEREKREDGWTGVTFDVAYMDQNDEPASVWAEHESWIETEAEARGTAAEVSRTHEHPYAKVYRVTRELIGSYESGEEQKS